MIRIGILGSDNSHALAFAKLCNLPMENGEYRYPDVRIAAIYGNDDDPQHTKDVAQQGIHCGKTGRFYRKSRRCYGGLPERDLPCAGYSALH